MTKQTRFWSGISIAIGVSVFSAPPVMANITPTRVTGGVDPETRGWSKIIMEWEQVRMEVTPAVCVVHGTYWLTNPGRPTTEGMAFPCDSRFPDDLNNFRAWVDHKPVRRVKNETRDIEAERKMMEKLAAEAARKHQGFGWGSSGGEGFEAWKSWEVAFARGGSHKITVAYDAAPRRAEDYEFEQVVKPKKADGSVDRIDTALMELVEGKDIQAKYVIFTGGRWNGKIRRGLFEADIETPEHWSVSVDPKPTNVIGRKYTWLFKNFKPAVDGGIDEILITFHPESMSNNDKAFIYKTLSQRHLREFDLICKIAEELIRLGYQRDGEALRFQSLQLWKLSDFSSLRRHHLDVTAPVEFDGALLMACRAVRSFDRDNMAEQSTKCAQILRSIIQAVSDSEDYRKEVVDDLEKHSEPIRDVCLKYGVDLVKN